MQRHMTRHILRFAFVGIFSGLCASVAGAQTPAPTPRTMKTATGQLGASINNAGLQQSFDLALRRDTRALGGTVAATPAGVRIGGWVELTPVRFFVLKAGAESGQYFGTFHSLTSFASRLDTFDPDARKARDAASAGRTTKLYVAPTLQVRAGRFAARSTLSLERWSSTVSGPIFYEPTRDTLLATDGDDITSLTTVVLYQRPLDGGGQFMVGPIHSVTRVHGDRLNQIQKVGAVAIHQMSGHHLGLVRPSLSAQAAYYMDDPHKHGQWSGALAIGFSLGRRR